MNEFIKSDECEHIFRPNILRIESGATLGTKCSLNIEIADNFLLRQEFGRIIRRCRV